MTAAATRRHLLCITGLTPQVVTETVYALHREGADKLPTDVHVLSTADGVERARLQLVSETPGWFRRLCHDYALPPIRFSVDHLHTLTDAASQPLRDIRNQQDNQSAADGITEWVRRLTADESASLHVSIAGGRKTLGFFAGYALSLFGRPGDRLSHVLVDPPFESHPGFFYPTPDSQVIYAAPPDQRPLDAREANVVLADIPFVRLRHGLPDDLLNGRARFSESVAAAQRQLGPVRLEFDLSARRLIAGEVEVNLPPVDLAFYAWLARRERRGIAGLPCPADGVPEMEPAIELLAEYRRVLGPMGDEDRVVAGLRYGMDKAYFLSRKSRVNKCLRQALGRHAASYQISPFGQRPRTVYRVPVAAERISFVNEDREDDE